MDYQVVTEHTLGLDVLYDWKFSIMGIPFFSFREKVVEWQEGRRVAYQAISGRKMYFFSSIIATFLPTHAHRD
jgi:hypothetical protein